MLSRAAERVYWLGRYLERAENTARIVQQYSQLLLDLPDEVGVGWDELITVFGARSTFNQPDTGEGSVLRFFISDAESSASLAFSIRMARENLRNSRDLLPTESWEAVNELSQFARRRLGDVMDDEDRFEVLSECIARSQTISGSLIESMSHGPPYQFLRLGRALERADMTSRIVDVATAHVRKDPDLVARFGSELGTNVLKSVSGFQMYRQYCAPRVDGRRVVEFLTRDTLFPRAIAYCINRCSKACAALPRGEATKAALDLIADQLARTPDPGLDAFDVSDIMDRLQSDIGQVHAHVAKTWFLPDGNQ